MERVQQIHWPMAGVVKRYGFSYSPPYSTPHALNVRPDSANTQSLAGQDAPHRGRERGGSRPGMRKMFTQELGGGQPVRSLNTITWVVDGGAPKSRIVAISNGILYREEPVGTLVAADPVNQVTGLFNPDLLIHSAERNQILYIADWSYTIAEANGVRAPKQYDPATDTISNWTATKGTVPTGCNCIAVWRDRLVLGGGIVTPHGLFMSRIGDPQDWDYFPAEPDAGQPVSLTLSDAGQVGDIITAISPHADNCLVIGCLTSIWMVQGDPADGGQVNNISQQIGVIDSDSWCVSPENIFIFLSQDGIYFMPVRCEAGIYPQSVSRERVPEELLSVDRTVTSVHLEYDVKDRGVHIFLSPRAAGASSGRHWFMDWETKSFWPVELGSADFEPFSIHQRKNYYSKNSSTLLGCRDGYLRHHRSDVTDDDGQAFTTEVWLGPFGDPEFVLDVQINRLRASLGRSSGVVQWSLHAGSSPEEAFESVAIANGSWILDGSNPWEYPRIRAGSLYLKLVGVPPWSWEGGVAVLSHRGRSRPV